MRIKRSRDCEEIVANDDSQLRELWHPDRGAGDLPYSLAVARVASGRRTAPHRLLAESELYYVLRGAGRMHVDGESVELFTGDSAIVPAGAEQWIESIGAEPLEVLLVVSPPWRAEHDVRRSPRPT